jgi:hypothetical protein
MTPDITNDALLFAIEADYVCGLYIDCDECPLWATLCTASMTQVPACSRSRALAAERGIDLSHLEA